MEERDARISKAEFERLVNEEMGSYGPYRFSVEWIAWGHIELRLHFHEGLLRPGGTVAGPVLCTLADAALYGVVLSVAGGATMAVTTDLTLHFLSRPPRGDVLAEGRLVKDEGRLVFGTVLMRSDGDPRPVAHATGSYAVPRGALAPRDTGSARL